MSRFEIQLPAEMRLHLGQLADELGLTSAALAKVAIAQLLADPSRLVGRPPDTPAEPAS